MPHALSPLRHTLLMDVGYDHGVTDLRSVRNFTIMMRVEIEITLSSVRLLPCRLKRKFSVCSKTQYENNKVSVVYSCMYLYVISLRMLIGYRMAILCVYFVWRI